MSIDPPVAVGVLGLLAAVAVYFFRKYIDVRLTAVSRFHERKSDAVITLRGLLSEIEHSVMHLVQGDADYGPVIEKHCAEVRKQSRAQSALVGDPLVVAIRDATDTAMTMTAGATDELRKRWSQQLADAYSRCDRLLKTVDVELTSG